MGTGTAFQNYVKEFSNLDKATQQAVLSSGLLSKVQKEQLISQMELSASTATLTAEQVQERLATELNSEADAKALLAKSGLITEKELETGATVEITTAKLNEAVANGTLSTSDAAVIAGALGITGANTTATTSFGLLTKAVWANVKAIGAWLLTTPTGWATLAIGAIAGLTIAYQNATLTIDEATDTLENSKSSYDSISDEVSQLTEELNECHSRMKELQDLGSLRSVVEDDELSKLQETNVELTRRLAILKEEQRLKAVDVAKDASNVMTTDVESQYSTIAIGGSDERGQKVKPEEEMRLAINAYREYAEEKAKIDAELLKDPENTELANESQKWQDKMDLAASRANEMAGYINRTEEAYKKIIDTGGTLTSTQTDLYNSSIALGNEYLAFTKTKFLNMHPEINGRKIITYAPTFRGGPAERKNFSMMLNIREFVKRFSDEYVLVIKMHPSVSKSQGVPYDLKEHVLNLSGMDMNDLLIVTDILVTDYSSVIFDYSLLKRPMIFFAYDLENYLAERNFYYEYRKFVPGPIVANNDSLFQAIEMIEEQDLTKVVEFRDRFFDELDGKSAQRIVKEVLSL